MKSTISVLLSTYNGEKYLDEQIESILAQENVNVKLLVRDDGSSDHTCDILNNYQSKNVLTWYTGNNLGPAMSFLDLMQNAEQTEYYAFCDQDDVWDRDKLKVAIEKLSLEKQNNPMLYLSTTRIVDENLNYLYTDTKDKYSFTFGESLYINPATGCTIVFNNILHAFINKFTPVLIGMHDSWIYKVCHLLDGVIIFDKDSHINYRQHSMNVVGMTKDTILQRFKRRINYLLDSGESNRLMIYEQLLKGYKEDITDERKKELLMLLLSYKKTFSNKYKLLKNSSFRTGSWESNFSLIVSLLFNKL